MKNHLLFLALCAALLSMGCRETQKSATIPPDFQLTVQRTACYGSCPVYTLSIDHSGKARYDGLAYTRLAGKWEKNLTNEQMNRLVQLMKEANFFSYEAEYNDEMISDLPSIIVLYTAYGETHKVLFRYGGPVSFLKLVQELEATVTEEDYQSTNRVE
ncbi:MAG: DUF6438 domain-containing protein [Bacteroidetes bacterium]|jgi:hypothetical protein|nr:DUF6438 domain-containing protein [Bacteroidota bacterium]